MSEKVNEVVVRTKDDDTNPEIISPLTLCIVFIGGTEQEFLMYKQMLSSSKYGCSYSLFHVSGISLFQSVHDEHEVDLIMLDLSSSEDADFKTFKAFHKKHPLVPKVILTDFNDESIGLKAIRAGAEDYMVKEVISSFALNRSIQYALERNQIEKSLWASNQAMKDFASTAAHDLKSPLSVIISFLDLFKHSEDIKKEEIDNIFNRISKSANRMHQLIDDLLKYAEVENRITQVTKVDLSQIIADICEDLNLNEELQYHSLPIIEGDRTQLYQLFKNLIENALKFHKENEKPFIQVHAQPKPDFSSYVEVMIKDHGIGIAEENIKRIFEAFQRVSSKYSGSGIGLATCKRIIDNHKGQVQVESQLNEGTTFIISLPIHQY